MIIIYLFFLIFLFANTKFIKDGINSKYLDKKTTTTINGLFVLTIFFSHFKTYIFVNNVLDEFLVLLVNKLGQLVVTSFLFYSGFGVYESIKTKEKYMKKFFIKRFIPTFFNFSFAIILFIILNYFLNNHYSFKIILLSFVGYESIGNSNWYMLAIFFLYLTTMFCFNDKFKFKQIIRIILLFIICVCYIFIISRYKESWYVNTILCYPFGMLYSLFLDKINNLIRKDYVKIIIISFAVLIVLYEIIKYFPNVYIYNIFAISFILFVVLLSAKFNFNSKLFYFFGQYVFWIYILQRIPMITFKGMLNNYVYFIVCFLITIIGSLIMKKSTDKIWKRLLYNK